MGLGLRVIAKALSLYVAQLATAVTVELNNFIFQLKKYFLQNDTVNVVLGNSGGKQLAVGGQLFVRDGKPRALKSGALVVYWYCNKKRTQGCKARLRTTKHYETEGRSSFLTPIPSHLHP